MKLIDVVENIENIEDELIVFQENPDDYNSDVILTNSEKGGDLVENENGGKYHYLIEIFLAKEFIDDWVRSLDYTPSSEEITRRLHSYAINDAYTVTGKALIRRMPISNAER